MATASGTTYQCTITGPNNGLYTAAVISSVAVPSNGAYFTIATDMAPGGTYQVSITASGLGGAKIYMTDGAVGGPLPSTTLTSTLTTYTGAPYKTGGNMMYLVIQPPVSSGMVVYFKDLSFKRLDPSVGGNFGINTTNPESPFTILGIGSAAAANAITLAQQWKTQQAIYATGAYALKFGAHYTPGVGSFSSIQSTEFYSGTEHPGNLSLNPLGGSVGIGVTSPADSLEVRGGVRISATSLASIGMSGGAGNFGAIEAFKTGDPNTKYPISLQTWGGYVGIGVANPIAPLHVSGYQQARTMDISGMANSGSGYYFSYGNSTLSAGWDRTWSFQMGIYCVSSIVTGQNFISASDERIKKNIQPIPGALDKIKRLDVVSYDRIDYREKGVDAGVIARNVQSVLPKAVAVTNFTIPNIYLPATHLKINSGVLIEVKCDDKDIKEGSKVKLMIMQGEKEVEHVSPMKNWTGSSFEVEEWEEYSEEDKVFAYGVEVDDFLNVDKEQIGILAAGAVKELDGIVAEQSREISELKRLVRSLLG